LQRFSQCRINRIDPHRNRPIPQRAEALSLFVQFFELIDLRGEGGELLAKIGIFTQDFVAGAWVIGGGVVARFGRRKLVVRPSRLAREPGARSAQIGIAGALVQPS
jgi:hypothetical protein